MQPRARKLALAALLLAGAGYRLFAAYPTELGRFGPASSALQAMHVLHGWRPLFYSGQAWMGPAGAYLIALCFKLFGATSLTLGLFSWTMSVLFLLAAVLLAHRCFGVDAALVVAALFLVPPDQVMYLAGQPRAHYLLAYVLCPAILLTALAVHRRHAAGRPLGALSLLSGLLAGFSFWNNMAVGPAVGASLLALAASLRGAFFTRVLPPWLLGWAVGWSPVIWFNLTHEPALGGQVNAANLGRLSRVVSAFVGNAWPRFWGVDFRHLTGAGVRALFVAALAWISLLYLAALVPLWRRWRRGESVFAPALVVGWFALHLAVTSASSYGTRFREGPNPIGYLVPLYAAAFAIPAFVLGSGLTRRAKALALLPFALIVGNNLVANREYPRRFLATLRAEGLGRVTRYPNAANPFAVFARGHGLEAAYLGKAFAGDSAKYQNFPLNLECFGLVTFADSASERYVDGAIAVDGARRIFWVGASRQYLATAGVSFREARVGRFAVRHDFAKEAREGPPIPARAVEASERPAEAGRLADGVYDTVWRTDPRPSGEASAVFALEGAAPLREILLFPVDVDRSPATFVVELSDDGVAWRRAAAVRRGAPLFWSVFHPYLKKVRPRMEVVLPEPSAARLCRLRFDLADSRAGIGIREVLFLGDGPAIPRAEWEADVDAVVRAVREGGRGAVLAGDHWWMDFFRGEGFRTAYISNEAVNDFGEPSPDLAAPVPLDFSADQLLIVARPHLPAVEGALLGRGVPFRAVSLRHHALLRTGPARVDPPLYWNGVTLNDLGPGSVPGGDRR